MFSLPKPRAQIRSQLSISFLTDWSWQKKMEQMKRFEMVNCKKNISFYKDQMRKNIKNRGFYSEQIELMQTKLNELIG